MGLRVYTLQQPAAEGKKAGHGVLDAAGKRQKQMRQKDGAAGDDLPDFAPALVAAAGHIAGGHSYVGALVHSLDDGGHYLRGVLQVGIHHQDGVIAGMAEAVHNGGSQPFLPPAHHHADGIFLGERGDQFFAAVAGVVVHEDDFIFPSGQRLAQALHQRGYVVALFICRYNNGKRPGQLIILC